MKSLHFAAVAALMLSGVSNLLAQANKATIDQACVGVLGKACSVETTLSATYVEIVAKINNRQLAGDLSSITYNYLIPMMKARSGMQATVIDWAYQANHCAPGTIDESYWMARFNSWQTYQALFNAIRAKGCTPQGPVTPAPPPVQYQSTAALQPAYQAVWGSVPGQLSPCPASTPALTCARTALSTYVNSLAGQNQTNFLSGLISPVFAQVIGLAPGQPELTAIVGAYLRSWSGADDLRTYLQTNRAVYSQTIAHVQLDNAGNVINGAGQTIPGTAGSYFLSVVNGQFVAQGRGSYTASAGGLTVVVTPTATPSGILVDNRSNPYKIVAQGGGNFQMLRTGSIVAQGGGNIVAQGGGNIILNGGGNIVAQGGLNIILNGGGNIILNGGGNLVGPSGGTFVALPPMEAASKWAAGLNPADLAALISQDGTSLVQAKLAAFVGHNGSALVNTNGSNATANNIYKVQSVGTPTPPAPPAVAPQPAPQPTPHPAPPPPPAVPIAPPPAPSAAQSAYPTVPGSYGPDPGTKAFSTYQFSQFVADRSSDYQTTWVTGSTHTVAWTGTGTPNRSENIGVYFFPTMAGSTGWIGLAQTTPPYNGQLTFVVRNLQPGWHGYLFLVNGMTHQQQRGPFVTIK